MGRLSSGSAGGAAWGCVRHLAVADLWVQARVRNGDVVLSKVDGANNMADVLTKEVECNIVNQALIEMNLRRATGDHRKSRRDHRKPIGNQQASQDPHRSHP